MDAYLTLIASHGNRRFDLDVKLNLDDDYIRIGAPVHEVLQVQPHLLNTHSVTVSNLYGVPLFQLHYHRKGAGRWIAHCSDMPRQSMAFELRGRAAGNVLHIAAADGWQFEADIRQLEPDRIISMLAAAVATLQQQGARRILADLAGAVA